MSAVGQDVRVQDRKDRKRIQNRLNQRARRERIKIEKDKTKPGKQPYRVGRWRLGPDVASGALGVSNQPTRPSPQIDNEHINDRYSIITSYNGTPKSTPSKDFEEFISPPIMVATELEHSCSLPLPVDHTLLHLIAYNVCRGFAANKRMLRTFANFIEAFDFPILQPEKKTFCEIVTVRPRDRPALIPHRLEPTQLQMNSPHPHWIDTLPFPDIRDNLIRKQLIFDHVQFLEDIVGDYVYVLPPAVPYETSTRPAKKMRTDYIPNNNPGLILWGEPYLRDSWEVTPRFLAKWAWLVGDCKDLIEVSNNQRMGRGERPLPVYSPWSLENKSRGSIIELE